MHHLTDAVHHDEQSITVTRLQSDGGLGSVGTLSISLFQGDRHWYLNRLLIQAPYRRQGHGRQLFELLVSVLKRRASFNSDWPQPDSILVEPGGYDSDPDELITFYQKLGFQDWQPGALIYRLWHESTSNHSMCSGSPSQKT